MTNEQRIFVLAFRIAESMYIKPGQPVKSEAEILAEFPDWIDDEPVSNFSRLYPSSPRPRSEIRATEIFDL